MPLICADDVFAAIQSRTLRLSDGAIGTQLMLSGIDAGSILSANFDRPQLVRSLHSRSMRAGAQMLTANTFGLPDYQRFLSDVAAGLELAHAAAGTSRASAGVWLSLTPQSLVSNAGSGLIDLILRFGSAAVLIETCIDYRQAADALTRIPAAARWRTAVTFAVSETWTLADGLRPEEAITRIRGAGARLSGMNCTTPEVLCLHTRELEPLASEGLLLQPCAEHPAAGETREDWAVMCSTLARLDGIVIGGCCGASPAHIKRLNSLITQGSGHAARFVKGTLC